MILVAAVGIATLAGSCSCSDRTVDGDDAPVRTEPVCVWLLSPKSCRADGRCSLLQDDANHRNPTACLCITEDEYDALGERLARVEWPEEGTLLEEFNEIAYEECQRISRLEGFVDECLEYYEAGRWLKDIYPARGDWANGKPPGFTCSE